MQAETVYFEKPGRENTEKVLRLVKQRADNLDIKTVVVASTTGDTAVQAVNTIKGMRIIIVTYVTGYHVPNTQEFTQENRQIIEAKGGILLTTAHAFAGISRAMRKKFDTFVIGDIIANTLRVFGDGMKVVIEIAMMAADAGLVRTDEDIIVIGGTGKGADTAVVLQPVNSQDFFDLKVKEILCKPRFKN
ncbi:MAG: pyruvate kinase alpha/beta domain-containing protein [Candidatus Kariarchaeaceae archaeon]|jgi:hypothetical protein